MRAIETIMNEGQKAENKRQERLRELTDPLRSVIWASYVYSGHFSAADVIELLLGFIRCDPLDTGSPFEHIPRYRLTNLATAVMQRERERVSEDGAASQATGTESDRSTVTVHCASPQDIDAGADDASTSILFKNTEYDTKNADKLIVYQSNGSEVVFAPGAWSSVNRSN